MSLSVRFCDARTDTTKAPKGKQTFRAIHCSRCLTACAVVDQKAPKPVLASGRINKQTHTELRAASEPSYIRTLPSAPELHRIMSVARLVGCTTDRELAASFARALTLPRRLLFNWLCSNYNICGKRVNWVAIVTYTSRSASCPVEIKMARSHRLVARSAMRSRL